MIKMAIEFRANFKKTYFKLTPVWPFVKFFYYKNPYEGPWSREWDSRSNMKQLLAQKCKGTVVVEEEKMEQWGGEKGGVRMGGGGEKGGVRMGGGEEEA